MGNLRLAYVRFHCAPVVGLGWVGFLIAFLLAHLVVSKQEIRAI